MSKFNGKSMRLISQWQLDKMESILSDRWHETWLAVQQRESAKENSQGDSRSSQISL